MKKRILTLLLSTLTCLTISAFYTQQVDITTEKGLSCDAVRSLAWDVTGVIRKASVAAVLAVLDMVVSGMNNTIVIRDWVAMR